MKTNAPHNIVGEWKAAAAAREVDRATRDLVGGALLFVLERRRRLRVPAELDDETAARWRLLGQCTGLPLDLELLTAACLSNPDDMHAAANAVLRAG